MSGPPCDGRCIMGSEVLDEGGLYDIAAYPDPECSRHGRPKKCWCGGDIVADRCSNADPNEVGP